DVVCQFFDLAKPLRETNHQSTHTIVRVMEVDVVSTPKHFADIPTKVAEMVLVVEPPGSDGRPRRLVRHVLQVLFTNGQVDCPEADVLVLAHTGDLRDRAWRGWG